MAALLTMVAVLTDMVRRWSEANAEALRAVPMQVKKGVLTGLLEPKWLRIFLFFFFRSTDFPGTPKVGCLKSIWQMVGLSVGPTGNGFGRLH